MPWGREYVFLRKEDRHGNKQWPKTQIYNYPVQGLGAELMAIARVSLMKRIKTTGIHALPVVTVHDSILLDTEEKEVDKVLPLIYNVFKDVPKNFERLFGVPFDVALNVEVQVGPTWGDMKDVDSALYI